MVHIIAAFATVFTLQERVLVVEDNKSFAGAKAR